MAFNEYFQGLVNDAVEVISRLSDRIIGIFDSSNLYGQNLGGCAVLLIVAVTLTIIITAVNGIKSLVWGK